MLCVQVLEGGLTLADPQVDISKVQPLSTSIPLQALEHELSAAAC
jgi:hypothetical protein